MIDRKALWTPLLLVAVMMAAAAWRFSLLPDWHHLPLNGPGGGRTINGLMLFWGPAMLLLATALLYARKWYLSGPEESLKSWGLWCHRTLLIQGLVVALMQAFMIARSLGIGTSLDRLAVSRAFLAMTGLILVAMGNALPKMPWLGTRIRFLRLDPWQWNQHLRLAGRMLVGLGLFAAIGGVLLPPDLFRAFFFSLWLAMLTMGLVYRFKLRRRPSPLS